VRALTAVNPFIYRYKWHFLGGVLFVVLSTLLTIFPAQLVRYAFDLVSEGIDLYHLFAGTQAQSGVYDLFGRNVLFYGVLIIVLALLRGIFLFFMRQTLIVMSRLVENDQKNQVYLHYQSLPLSFYRRHSTGDLMSRISEDVGRVRMYLGPGIMYFLQLVVLFVLIVPLMLMVNVKLTLYTLAPLPVLSVSIFYVNNLIERKSDQIQRSLAAMTTFTQEAFSGIRVLKSFSRQADSHAQFTKASNEYKEKSLSLNFVNSLFFPLILFLIGLSTLITVWVGGQEVIRGTITTGTIAEFLIYVNLLTWPVTALGWTSSLVQRAEASQARLNEFLDQKTDIVSRQNLQHEMQGDIVFDNVSFTYPDTGIRALRDGRAKRWPSSATRARAKAPSPLCSAASTTLQPAKSRWTASTCATTRWTTCASKSATCRRTCSCFPTASGTTSTSASTTRPRKRCCKPPATRPCTTTSWASPKASTRRSASGASRFPAARSSA
jgi:ATP-binding cassette subfamily B multidrug efflux pump